METPEEKKDTRLLIPRENGFGWDLNWANKWSYAWLALILGLPFLIIILAICFK